MVAYKAWLHIKQDGAIEEDSTTAGQHYSKTAQQKDSTTERHYNRKTAQQKYSILKKGWKSYAKST